MKRLVLSVVLALVLLLIPASGALADTTQEVNITATPGFVSISNDTPSWVMGTVAMNSTYYWNGGTPTFPLADGDCTSTVTNNGQVGVNITLTGEDFLGGVNWTIAGTTGENQVVLKAWKSGDLEAAAVTLTTSAQAFISSLAISGTKKWEMRLESGTFTDGVGKSADVTLTATAS